jgi:hypothetical protein
VNIWSEKPFSFSAAKPESKGSLPENPGQVMQKNLCNKTGLIKYRNN